MTKAKVEKKEVAETVVEATVEAEKKEVAKAKAPQKKVNKRVRIMNTYNKTLIVGGMTLRAKEYTKSLTESQADAVLKHHKAFVDAKWIKVIAVK